MTSAHRFLQNLTIFGSIVPLAIFLGYLLVVPTDLTTLSTFGLVFLALTFPLILRWHHPLLVAAWNMGFVIPLRGRPQLCLVVAFASIAVLVARRTLGRGFRLQNVRSVTAPLLLLSVVILLTAMLRGGTGFGVFGGKIGGGKRYLLLIVAIVGYFALSSQRIAEKHGRMAVLIFLLGSVSYMVGFLFPYVPRALYFLYQFFPPETTGLEIIGGHIVRTEQEIGRTYVLTIGFMAIANALMAYFGLRALMTFRAHWVTRYFTVPGPVVTGLFGTVVLLSFAGGFRSALLGFVLTSGTLFIAEGLLKTRLLPMTLAALALLAAVILPVVTKLPMSIQRTLSVLPIEVSPIAKFDAQMSTEWRLNVWRRVLPQVPNYLWLGKGFAIDMSELQFAEDMVRTSRADSSEVSLISGDYHSGPLSLIVPLGVFGVAAFLWFIIASARVLWFNFKRAPAELQKVNGFLFAAFVGQTIFFFGVYGHFYSDFMGFTGLVAMSISINGGLRRAADVPRPLPAPALSPAQPGLQPAVA